MKLEDVTPEALRKETDKQLLSMHFHMTMLHRTWLKGDKDIDIKLVKQVHDLVVEELDHREVSSKKEHLTPMDIEEVLAKVHPSGEEQEGKEITLDDLPEFGDFYLNDRFVLLVGSLPNQGKTKNDMDFLIAWPEGVPEEILKPITFRLWRQFPEELQSRCSFHLDTYHGPFTNSIPLYRLKCERINPDMEILQAEEGKEGLLEVAYSSSKKLFAKNIVTRIPEGSKVLFDPMCGTGSILIEAARKGMTVIGNDLNPFASRYTKGIFEGEKLEPPDIELLSEAPEKPGWFTQEYKGKHPTDKNLRIWVDSLVQHVEECFTGEKLLAARAVVCSLLGKFFRGTHTGMKSGYYYQDANKSKQMLRSAVIEVNRMIEQVGGKGTITNLDAFEMEIPEADVVFFDPPALNETAHRHALSEYKTRNSILLQKSFEYTISTNERLKSLLEKLSKSSKVVIVCSSEGSEIDWEEALKKIRPKVSAHKLMYFKQSKSAQALPSLKKSRKQMLYLAEAVSYEDVPAEDKAHRFAVQHHWRGKSCHADLRLQADKDTVLGWTIFDLLPDVVQEPITTLEDAKKIEAHQDKYFKINWRTGEFAKRLKKGATKPVNVTLMAQQKIPVKMGTVDIEGIIPPGEFGSTVNFPGVLVNIDRGTVEYGAQKAHSHEYFFKGKALKGKYVFRRLGAEFGEALLNEDFETMSNLFEELFGECYKLPAGTMLASLTVSEAKVLPPSEEKTTGLRWFLIKPIDQTPYVLTSEAVRKNWMPPSGYSALPKQVREAIPDEYKYWTLKDSGQAKKVRDDLYDLIRTNKIKLPLVEGGSGSGNAGHAGRPGQLGGSSSGVSKGATRSMLAKKSYKPSTRKKQKIAAATEKKIAKAVGGKVTPDNSPFDVKTGKAVIEVKTIIEGKNPKITMHPSSLRRKKEAAKKEKKKVWTVVHDQRGGKSDFYLKNGVGSFRLSSMRKVTEEELVKEIA